MKLFTSFYANLAAIDSGSALVGITRNPPKPFPTCWVGILEPLVPPRVMEEYPRGRFLPLYEERLESVGSTRIRELLVEMTKGRDAVLLGENDLGFPGVWCHRTFFADWWQRVTGEEVHELPSKQMSLF